MSRKPGWVEFTDLINHKWVIWAPSVIAVRSSDSSQCGIVFNDSPALYVKGDLDDIIQAIDNAVEDAEEWDAKNEKA